MAIQKIPADWKNCATCSHWCGRKMPDMFCKFVEFDNNEKARCAGGGFNNGQVMGMSTCIKWERQYR